MKLKKCMIALLVLLMLIIMPTLSFRIYTHTFSSFIIDKNSITVFYPKGIADAHKNIFAGINEEHRLWKYNLNNKEITDINDNLSNGVWQPLCCDELQYVYAVYFDEAYLDFNVTDQLYYCVYDLEKEKHITIDISDTLLYNQQNLLFVYNKTTAEYYCVSRIS